jgi:CheY-like chemotaxis protein
MTGPAGRALVAEDDPVIRMLVVETLEDAGWDVLEAVDGADAFRLMDDPDSVSIVVTDFNMPGFDGVAVAKRARERHPAIPVVFISARPDVLARAGAPEPYIILRKPFTMAELATEVERVWHARVR